MSFMKPKTIYENKKTRIYINQCYNKGKKTKLYVVRRDDDKGIGRLLGTIKFDGRWRQYVFIPEDGTKWSAMCLRGVAAFCDVITVKWRIKVLLNKK